MDNVKHTPGPWQAWNSHGGRNMRRWRVGSLGKTAGITLPVASLANEDDGVSGDEQVANAYLIEAAPDLLAALRLVESSLSAYRATGAFTPGQPSGWLMAQVADAIAKAEGRG